MGCAADHPAARFVGQVARAVARAVARGWARPSRKVVPVRAGNDAQCALTAGREHPPDSSPCGVSIVSFLIQVVHACYLTAYRRQYLTRSRQASAYLL
jgi:hypothetical protein